MYLLTIYQLGQDSDGVHSVDIATRLAVSKPSVNRALKILKNDGLIDHELYGSISLTAEGKKMAAFLQDRRSCIFQFLQTTLKLDPEIAEKDACRIEHIISPETLAAIKNLLAE